MKIQKLSMTFCSLFVAAWACAATWNDMVPHSNAINNSFWNTTQHAYVVNYPGQPTAIAGLPLRGSVAAGADAVQGFDGRVATEDESLFTEIILRFGLLLILK